MELVQPKVRILATPTLNKTAIHDYLQEIGGLKWWERVFDGGPRQSDAEALVEFCGRLCYKSWDVGLNANVTKVREDSAAYLRNILDSRHGSVLQHVSFTFLLQNVSRVFTHEQVRHVAGTAFSQESMRYVRLTEIPFWFPNWALADSTFMHHAVQEIERQEQFQRWMSGYFGLDDEGVPFSEKKAKTSFMRRFAPNGVATNIVMTANFRSIRHMIEMRTSQHAEEEIVLVYRKIAQTMIEECPLLFGDYTQNDSGEFVTPFGKV